MGDVLLSGLRGCANGFHKTPYIGMLLIDDTIQAIKISCLFRDFKSFKSELEKSVHFNSHSVRVKRANNILKWFFPLRSSNNLLTEIWQNYQDENLLLEIMRYQFLVNQPVMAKFVTGYLFNLPLEACIPHDVFRNFLFSEYGYVKPYLLNNLRINCRSLGFISGKKNCIKNCDIVVPKTSFLILTHYLLSSKPRTVTISNILENPYWKYLGIRESQTVRQILHQADSEGIISKYIIADQLEQITTLYSFKEFIQKRIQML